MKTEELKESISYQKFLLKEYKKLSLEEKTAIDQLIKNYSLSKDKKEKVKTTENARKLLSVYYKRYRCEIFDSLRKTDPFVNALFVKYGWAITVHKSLGSKYKEIILKGYRKENDNIATEDYFRWLYSGISSSETVYINSPQRINPLMNSTFEDNSIEGKLLQKKKSLLIFDSYEVEQRFMDRINSIENKNVIGAICEISKNSNKAVIY